MSTDVRVGLGIGRDEVRAVVLRGEVVTWRGARTLETEQPLAEAIGTLLAGAPLSRRFGRTPVMAAVGPSGSQVKPLAGLPAVSDRKIVDQLLRANISRFFLRNGVGLVSANVHRLGDAWWGAVFEEPVIDQVAQACERLGLRLEGGVPTATALVRAFGNGSVVWVDGKDRLGVVIRNGCWTTVHRKPADAHDAEPHPGLVALGVDAARYADAFAAACCNRRSPLAVLPAALRQRPKGASRRIGLACAFVVVVLVALSARAALASRQLRTDERRLASLGSARAEWAPVAGRLQDANVSLEEIARFARSRTSTTQLLGRISKALPESTAIVLLRLDSASSSLTVLSASAASVVPDLAAVPGIHEPRASGALTREIIGGSHVQRLGVRFRMTPRLSAQSQGRQ